MTGCRRYMTLTSDLERYCSSQPDSRCVRDTDLPCSKCSDGIRYVTNQPPKGNSAFHPSGVGKWVPASTRKAKAGMFHSVSGCTRGVQVKLWDTSRTRAIPEHLRSVFTTRRYTNPRIPLPLCQVLLLSIAGIRSKHDASALTAKFV